VKIERENNLPFLKSAAKSLQLENARLRAEAAAEREARAELEARLAELTRQSAEDLAREHETNVKLQEEVKRLAQELQALQEQLDLRTRNLYGRSTERRSLDGAAGAKKEKKPRKERKGHGPTAQPDLAKVEVKHKLEGEELVCTACGGQLQPMGTTVEEAELINIEKRKVVLEQHLRTIYNCKCGNCLKTAPGPLKLIQGGRYALSFTVHVAYMKYFAHMPLERQAKMFGHDACTITTATLCDQLDALATALANTHEAIWKVLQAEKVLRADETPWAVLSNGFNENEQFYAWVAVGSKYVAFRLLDTRSAEGAASILGGFSGTLMVDGLTSYPAAARRGPGSALQFIVANCHAHARRKFVEIEKHWPVESRYAIALYRKLYDIEREGKKTGADLAMLRREKSKPLVDELFAWAKEQQKRPEVLASSGLSKALAYLVNHEVGLRVFLEDAAVPIDNNESERAVRPTVLGRMNYKCSRSRRGTEVHAIISTLIESAKRCGVPPEAYLLAAAEHALMRAGAVLLPDEFKLQLDAVRDPPIRAT
jgi:transposase